VEGNARVLRGVHPSPFKGGPIPFRGWVTGNFLFHRSRERTFSSCAKLCREKDLLVSYKFILLLIVQGKMGVGGGGGGGPVVSCGKLLGFNLLHLLLDYGEEEFSPICLCKKKAMLKKWLRKTSSIPRFAEGESHRPLSNTGAADICRTK